MSLSIQQYKEILSIGLDLQPAQLRGGLVFDDFDPAVNNDNIMRRRLETLLKQKRLDSLEKMLQNLIEWFRFKDDHNFASILFEKTGYTFEPLPAEQICISTSRNISVGNSGKGVHSLTYVCIELPTASGSIYCIRGLHNLKADWPDKQTIEIIIPKIRDEVERVHLIKMYNETITIQYKEQSL
jgi:hypothetical protein